jgi:hypothetical protein
MKRNWSVDLDTRLLILKQLITGWVNYFRIAKMKKKLGEIHTELKLSNRVFECPSCRLHLDRDHNAAININREGLRQYKLAFQL